jgi:hypothetical protein
MKLVLLVYQGATPLPGSDRRQALPKAEQRRFTQITPSSTRRTRSPQQAVK